LNDHGIPGRKRSRILKERADALAAATTKGETRRIEIFVAILEIGGERFGVPCEHLREIARSPRLARLPCVPSWCCGLAQVRGELMTAIDIADLLHLGRCDKASFMAVVSMDQRSVGLLADGVIGLRDVFAEDVASSLDYETKQADRVVRATTKYLVSILGVDRLLERSELIVENGMATASDHRSLP
jgi:chemotaxis signal transduction protein